MDLQVYQMRKETMTPTKLKKVDRIKKHKHVWKYSGGNVRVCEAPFPTIESCGKEERMTINGWVDAYNKDHEK